MLKITLKRKKRNMYGSKTVKVDGIVFDSEKEARHYVVLKKKEPDGEIADLELQKTWVLQDGFRDKTGRWRRPITYLSDFSYTDVKTGKKIVEDVKSRATARDDVFAIKKKMFIKRYENEYDFKVVV